MTREYFTNKFKMEEDSQMGLMEEDRCLMKALRDPISIITHHIKQDCLFRGACQDGAPHEKLQDWIVSIFARQLYY